eukprot:3647727-Pleurochrysis_carterae.AAC.1
MGKARVWLRVRSFVGMRACVRVVLSHALREQESTRARTCAGLRQHRRSSTVRKRASAHRVESCTVGWERKVGGCEGAEMATGTAGAMRADTSIWS